MEIGEAFAGWKAISEEPLTPPMKPLVPELLGVGHQTIGDELRRIETLCAREHSVFHGHDYDWARLKDSFPDAANAHLQYQLMWILDRGLMQMPQLRPARARIIRGSHVESRGHSPSIKDYTEEFGFVRVPSAFLKGLYEFHRVHFELARLGAPHRSPSTAMQQRTNWIGGQDIASSIWLARGLFEYPRGPSTAQERERIGQWYSFLEDIRARRTRCDDLLVEGAKRANDGYLDGDGLVAVGVIAESYAVGHILQDSIRLLHRQ